MVLLDPSREKQGDEKRDSEKRHQMWHETTHKNMEKLLGIQKKDINKKEKKGTKHNRIWGVIEISLAVRIHLADILKSPRLFLCSFSVVFRGKNEQKGCTSEEPALQLTYNCDVWSSSKTQIPWVFFWCIICSTE